ATDKHRSLLAHECALTQVCRSRELSSRAKRGFWFPPSPRKADSSRQNAALGMTTLYLCLSVFIFGELLVFGFSVPLCLCGESAPPCKIEASDSSRRTDRQYGQDCQDSRS